MLVSHHSYRFGNRQTRFKYCCFLFPSFVTLGELLNFSAPQFFNKDNNVNISNYGKDQRK